MHEDDDFPDHVHLGPGEEAHDVDGIESLSLNSVGIDIGSSTSHLVFSHLVLRREGAHLSTRFTVSEREVLYRSPILLTPYSSPTTIDVAALDRFFRHQYEHAGYTPETVDTGAVVITGEALNKENARPIAELFSAQGGKFICASAGPNHEALLAAHGCGAVALSLRTGEPVLNVDIGGGTTKFSLVRSGTVVATAAISVGARLVAFDEDQLLTRVEAPVAMYLGHRLSPGDPLTSGDRRALVEGMTNALFAVLEGTGDVDSRLLVTPRTLPGYKGLDEVRYLVFSGGVSEYVNGHSSQTYGDLGHDLGQAIRLRLQQLPVALAVHDGAEGIRATVIGAGEYTIQASGVTSYISNREKLPVFGLEVVKVNAGDPAASLAKLDIAEYRAGLALAISPPREPTYQGLFKLATDLNSMARGQDLFLILDADLAKSLGGILKEELRYPAAVIAVDGIDVGDLDFVDIGRPMGASEALPVTVKSLLFPHS